MPLLRRASPRPAVPLRPYTTLLCPYNGFQVSFCRGLCRPIAGVGTCGRLAPHALLGRTQLAIAASQARPGTVEGDGGERLVAPCRRWEP